MKVEAQIEKTRAAILGLLALLPRKIWRTELVKLIFLSDNLFYESTGRTITGNTYMWDHYGPNAVSHAIANEADELAGLGKIRMSARPSLHGGSSYQYWVDEPSSTWKDVQSALDVGECQILRDIVKAFGRLSLESLVKRSKDSHPFANAQQYDILELEQDERAKRMRELVDSSGEFLEEVELALSDAHAGRWVWDDELESFTAS